jgi:hypothetical protein
MGYYEQYTLDAFGNRVTVRNKLGGIVTNSYDRRGLLLSETLPMAVGRHVRQRPRLDASPTASNMMRAATCTKKIEAYGLAEQRTTTYVYDKADRLIETRGDSVGVLSQSDHASLSSGRLRARRSNTTSAAGSSRRPTRSAARTLFYYDKLNRKSGEIGGGTAGSTQRLHLRPERQRPDQPGLRHRRDAAGHRRRERRPAAPGRRISRDELHLRQAQPAEDDHRRQVRTGAWNGSYYATASAPSRRPSNMTPTATSSRRPTAAADHQLSFYDRANRQVARSTRRITSPSTLSTPKATSPRRKGSRPAPGLSPSRPATADPGARSPATPPTASPSSPTTGTAAGSARSGSTSPATMSAAPARSAPGVHGAIQYSYNGLGQV